MKSTANQKGADIGRKVSTDVTALLAMVHLLLAIPPRLEHVLLSRLIDNAGFFD